MMSVLIGLVSDNFGNASTLIPAQSCYIGEMRTLAFLFGVLLSFVTWAQMPDRGTWMAGGDDSGGGLPAGGFPWIVAGIWLAGIVIASFLPKRAKAVALPIAQLWPLLVVAFVTVKWALR